MKPFFCFLVIIILKTSAIGQYADPAITGSNFISDETNVGLQSQLNVSFVNGGFSSIPANSIELTINTPIYYSSNGVSGPFGEGAELFDWVYIDNDIWRGTNNQMIEGLSGGIIKLQVNGLIESNTYEVTNINVQPVANFGSFNDNLANNNLQPGLFVSNEAILPVTWRDFTIENKDDFHFITFSVSQERNLSHYEVLRSLSSTTSFEKIKTIQPKDNGLSSNKYTYDDFDIESVGNYYYRIKQVDLDGKYTLSDIKSVYRAPANTTFTFYPNPTTNYITLNGEFEANQNYTVHLLGNDGRTIKITSLDNQSIGNKIDLTNELTGQYYLILYKNGQMLEKHKLIKI